VRALARERGVDLATLRPTGPDGSVSRSDVLAAATPKPEAAAAFEGEALRGTRRTMALNMARAHASVVPATLFDEAEIAAWWSPASDVTLRLIRAVAAAAAAAPALNAWFDGISLSRRFNDRVDLGVAIDTDRGLIVPVLRDIGRRDAAELRATLNKLKAAAHDRSLPLEDLRGATITLSNFGVLAGRHAALVILPPQTAILGAGRIGMRAFPEGAAAVFRPVLPLSLTFDHRAVTGGEAAAFMAAAIADLGRPA
jgi:pyruvate dehydrogenase E2 component (dihydrolipoamide acetyltransferase)